MIKKFEYKKFDLHLHTFKNPNQKIDDKNLININEENVDDFYKKLIENKIKLIAITNHNYFSFSNYSGEFQNLN